MLFVDGKLTIFAREPGTTTLTIQSTDQLTGSAEAELEVTVLEVQSDVRISFDPEPGPRGVISDIVIEATSVNGRDLNQNNTFFGIDVVGAGSIHSRYPPRLKTAITDPAQRNAGSRDA